MKTLIHTICILILTTYTVFGQEVGIGTTNPAPSSILDINSTSKGLLIPRMDSMQRKAITSPANGLLVYDTSLEQFYYRKSNTWVAVPISVDGLQDGIADYNRGNIYIGLGGDDADSTVVHNASYGTGALTMVKTGSHNTAVGSQSQSSNISGFSNTSLGRFALSANKSNSNNTAVGANALSNSEPNFSTGIGAHTLQFNSGYGNAALGYGAGGYNANHSSNFSVYLGFNAGSLDTADHRLYIDNSNTLQPLIWGDFNNDSVKIYGTLSIKDAYTLPSIDGTSGQVMMTDGNGQVAWGAPSSASSILMDGDGDTRVEVEEGSDDDIIRLYADTLQVFNFKKVSGNNGLIEPASSNILIGYLISDSLSNNAAQNIVIGPSAGRRLKDSYYNILIGSGAGENTTSNFNTFVGQASGYTNTSGIYNTYLGGLAGNTANGTENTYVGGQAGRNAGTGNYNLYGGAYAGSTSNGNYNTILGYRAFESTDSISNSVAVGAYALQKAGLNATTSYGGAFNTAIGYQSLTNTNSGQSNTALGYDAAVSNTSGSHNITVGSHAARQNMSGSNNIAIGNYALYSSTSTSDQIAIGDSALYANTSGPFPTGAFNLAIGKNALQSNTSGASNLAIGANALQNNTTGQFNCSVGEDAMKNATNAFGNTAVGQSALLTSAGAEQNCAFGTSSLRNNTKNSNSAFGYWSLRACDAEGNSVFGSLAGKEITSGKNNTAMGALAVYNNLTGQDNVVVGYQSLFQDTVGSYNTLLGTQTLENSMAASNNTIVGYQAGRMTQGGSNVFIGHRSGYNELGSNRLYIDNDSTSQPLIWGDFSADSLRYNGKVEINSTASPHDFRFTEDGIEPSLQPNTPNYGKIGRDGNHLYQIYSNFFYAGAAANYLVYSDRRLKKDIRPLANHTDSFMKLAPVRYNLKDDSEIKGAPKYKVEQTENDHIGFIAQDVQKIYPELVQKQEQSGTLTMSYHGLIPIMVNVIQNQKTEIQQMKNDIENLESELAEIKELLIKNKK